MDLSEFLPKGDPAKWSLKQRLVAYGAAIAVGLAVVTVLRRAGARVDDQVDEGDEPAPAPRRQRRARAVAPLPAAQDAPPASAGDGAPA